MRRLLILTLAICTLIPFTAGRSKVFAQAQGNIELKMVAETEIMVTDAQGNKQTKRVEAAKIVPGEKVIYTITYTNISSQPAENVFITNPIPEHMTYMDGSAIGAGTVITFSVDGGATYDVAAKLRVKNSDGTMRSAVGSDFTNVRWTFQKPLTPKTKGTVEYRAILQ